MPLSEPVLEVETKAVEGAHAGSYASFTGLLALIASITMLFAAFSSAYIVRRGISSEWTPLPPSALPRSALPSISAMLLLLGSAILEWGRRSVVRSSAYVVIALGVGAGLIVTQYLRELIQTGASAAASPAIAFIFIFSSGFELCLIGGIVAIVIAARRESTMACTALYWHYVTALWLWVLLLFTVWR